MSINHNNELRTLPTEINMLDVVIDRLADGIADRLERKQSSCGMTVDQLFQMYLENYAKVHCKSWKDMQRCYKNYFQEWSNLDLYAVQRVDVQAWHARLGEEISHTTANRALELLVMIYNKAAVWGLTNKYNPGSCVRKFQLKSRSRFLQPEEFERFFAALQTLRYETTRDCLMMCLLTGARKSNVRHMRWDEISFERAQWHIPRTKNGDSQIVPLVSEALEILSRREGRASLSPWVFESRLDPNYPIGKNLDEAWAMVLARSGLSDLRIHDLRRTMASWQAITGANISVIAATLNHKDLESTAIYARLNTEPIRAAMETAVDAMFKSAGKERTELSDVPIPQDCDEFLTTKECAELLQITEKQLHHLRYRDGGPPFQKNGFTVHYFESKVLTWMRANRDVLQSLRRRNSAKEKHS